MTPNCLSGVTRYSEYMPASHLKGLPFTISLRSPKTICKLPFCTNVLECLQERTTFNFFKKPSKPSSNEDENWTS